jgi:hypothetical protein
MKSYSLLAVLFTNAVPVCKHKRHELDYDVEKISSPSKGYQELCQVHFYRMMVVDISDTTVPNLIYV